MAPFLRYVLVHMFSKLNIGRVEQSLRVSENVTCYRFPEKKLIYSIVLKVRNL